MKPVRITAGVAGAVVFFSGAAFAADLPAPEVIPHVPHVAPAPIEVGSGWYLRGDVGYAFSDSPEVVYDAFATTSINPDVYFENEHLDDFFMVGAGAGFKFNDYFRVDGTIDYKFLSEFKGNTGASGCGHHGVGCTSTEQADVSILTFMANAYIDLGNYYGFTPYVGGGVGGALVQWQNYTSTPAVAVEYSGQTDFVFTAAAMGGVSYDVTNNLAVDLGYRYQYIDGGDVVTDGGFGKATYDNLNLHEVRVGLRYMLGGGQVFPQQPVHTPIVTKF